jgi:periplasmic divalent cation tolerance protein
MSAATTPSALSVPASTPSTPSDFALSVFFATFPDALTAKTVARALVEEHLIACANIVPNVTSIYRWQEAIEETCECAAWFKSLPSKTEALRARYIELHPYDTPELLEVAVDSSLPSYANWVRDSVLGPRQTTLGGP